MVSCPQAGPDEQNTGNVLTVTAALSLTADMWKRKRDKGEADGLSVESFCSKPC